MAGLCQAEIAQYRELGYLRVPVFRPRDLSRLRADLDRLVDQWAAKDQGWTGPWRTAYMDPETEKHSQLVHLHDLHRYAASWNDAVRHPKLARALAALIGPSVELHHTTLHFKPPETGHPFPMHQDSAFYRHADARYTVCLVHLDDTHDDNGCIRLLAGSHRRGHLQHVTQTPAGECTPHLPTASYDLEETVPVPACAGDVVLFDIFLVHGSRINRTGRARRIVRFGYRNPDNVQLTGQSLGRPGPMIAGIRPRAPEQPRLGTSI